MPNANEHDNIRSALELLVEENETVEDFEDWDDQFYVQIDGGKNPQSASSVQSEIAG